MTRVTEAAYSMGTCSPRHPALPVVGRPTGAAARPEDEAQHDKHSTIEVRTAVRKRQAGVLAAQLAERKEQHAKASLTEA